MTTQRLSDVLLGLFLIAFAIGTFTNIEVVPIVIAVLAIGAGILKLFFG